MQLVVEYEVERTGFVDWQDNSGQLEGLLLWPVLVLAGVAVWLIWRAFGRGWTLHVHDARGRRVARTRFRTRQEAEAALAAHRAADGHGEGAG